MVISNGGKVHNGGSVGGTIGLTGTASNSSVLVTGTNSLWTNSGTTVGSSGASNSLVISNGGKVANSFVGVIGTTVTGSNNWVLVTGTNSLWTNTRALSVGVAGGGNSLTISDGGTVRNAAATFIGSNSVGNSVLVTGSNSLWAITSSNTVGRSGSGNSMVISNGGKVQNTTATIGHDVTATNNWALVTGAGSTWSNSSTLTIGGAFNGGGSGTLTVANGGLVAASDIAIASGSNSIGTLNIGRFGTNDTAGTINTATIAFGAGTGAINFNQSDSTTLSAAISGNGSVNQLGSGTTTLSVSNSYTGDTTISAGTLRLTNENAAGTGSVIQTTMASLVEFLGGGRMTNRMTAFQYSFANSFEAAGQVTLADTASSIAVASGATVTGSGSFIGTGGLTKKGLGTLSLTAGNSFSGPLSVEAGTLALVASGSSAAGSVTSVGVSSGATLLVSQSNQMNNSATVTLSGGTITRGSDVSEVFGNLNLTQSSFLDFGSGTAGTMTFGTYTPSALLTINSFGLGNTLVFGSNLTDSINNTSLFQFSGGFTSAWNGTSTFTITAIPETSTCVAALGLLALGALPLVRRNRARVS